MTLRYGQGRCFSNLTKVWHKYSSGIVQLNVEWAGKIWVFKVKNYSFPFKQNVYWFNIPLDNMPEKIKFLGLLSNFFSYSLNVFFSLLSTLCLSGRLHWMEQQNKAPCGYRNIINEADHGRGQVHSSGSCYVTFRSILRGCPTTLHTLK